MYCCCVVWGLIWGGWKVEEGLGLWDVDKLLGLKDGRCIGIVFFLCGGLGVKILGFGVDMVNNDFLNCGWSLEGESMLMWGSLSWIIRIRLDRVGRFWLVGVVDVIWR